MSAPRLEIDLEAITHNTRTLVSQLEPLGIGVTGITKASLGSPGVAAAMLRGGASGLGDSRVENLARLRAGVTTTTTLIRSPMMSQAALVVRDADVSLNTEAAVIDSLAAAALSQGTTHAVVVMVELGDLREGVPVADVVDLCRHVDRTPGVELAGLGTNLACQSGVAPDQLKMDELSQLVEKVESGCDRGLSIVSGGNSANLDWALSTADAGHINDLRLGEAILLGTEPLHRRVLDGLRADAFSLTAEVIEVKTKPALPWGDTAQAAFGSPAGPSWRRARPSGHRRPRPPGHRPRRPHCAARHHRAGHEQRPSRARRGGPRRLRRRRALVRPRLRGPAACRDLTLRRASSSWITGGV